MREGGIISGLQFNNTEEGGQQLEDIFDTVATYVGVNSNGICEIAETTVSAVNTDETGWNGVLVGKGSTMAQIGVGDKITQLKFATSMSTEDVVTLLSGFTNYTSSSDGGYVLPLVQQDDGQGNDIHVVEVHKQSDGEGGYNYFICVDSDALEDYRNHVVVFASAETFETKDGDYNIGKTGWIDSYVAPDEVMVPFAGFGSMSEGIIMLTAFPVEGGDEIVNAQILAINTLQATDISEDQSNIEKLELVYSSVAFDDSGDSGLVATQGWQNLDADGVYDFGYNDILTYVNDEIEDWNGTLMGAVEADVDTYTITGNITNGYMEMDSGEDAVIPEDGRVWLMIYADNGYELPDSVTVSGATAYYAKVSNQGWLVLDNPTGNATVSAECPAEAPVPSGLTPFEAGGSQTITGIEFDTTKSIQEVVAILSELTYTEGSASLVVVDGQSGAPTLLAQSDGTVYVLLVEGNTVVFASDTIQDFVETAGWQNLTDGAITLTSGGTVTAIEQSEKWNDGSLIGAITA